MQTVEAGIGASHPASLFFGVSRPLFVTKAMWMEREQERAWNE